ncbi:MAG: transporter substrate-binding domain-containing protein [Paucibacter sp.]|nr:transporter substrate-binding domain-containing protein [Roseateles sp.]
MGERTTPHAVARRSVLLAALFGRVARGVEAASVPIALDESADLQRMLDRVEPDLDFALKRIVVPWPRLLSMAEQGTAIGMSIVKTKEREARLAFSEPIFLKRAWMIVRRGSTFAYQRLADLGGRHICLRRGVSYGDDFEASEGRDYHLDLVDATLEGRLRMVQRGRCDMTVWSSASPSTEVAARRIAEWPELAAQLEVVPVPMLTVGAHFATRKDGPLAAWLPRLDVALRRERDALQRLAIGRGDGP